jgi:magnesium transporter
MAHPLFGPDVRYMLAEGNSAGLKDFCETLHPSTVAETLTEDEFTPEQVWNVLRHTDVRQQASIFEYFSPSWQLKLVEGAGREPIAKLIEQMSHDDRVDLLRRLSPQVAEGLLRLVDEVDRRDIATLFRYTENTVGSLMTTDYAWLPKTLTAGQAIDRLRQQAPDRETIYYVYILDETSRRLAGVVSLRDLILADRNALVQDLMEKDLLTLNAGDDKEKAAEAVARYDFLALPVVDEEGRLVGIVTHDDVIDLIQQEATEDLQKQAGLGLISENYLEASFLVIWRKRAAWLAVLFGAELLTFTALSANTDAIQAILVLSLFVPLCLSTGGNSGSQAATLITRSLALGHFGVAQWKRVLRHEVMMGTILGVTLGTIAFFRGAITSGDLRSDTREQEESFDVMIPAEQKLNETANGVYNFPEGTVLTTNAHQKRILQIVLPPGQEPKEVDSDDPVRKRFRFPANSTTRSETVGRWALAAVIAQSVAAICLWGTLIGAMLPLLLRWLGKDPALAASPLVATFVDVTGIFIYFSIAKLYLL